MAEENEEHPVTPAILGLIALLSIGGLLFLGYTAKLTGNAYEETVSSYTICCTSQTWKNAPIGYTQGNAFTTTVYCPAGQGMAACCLQQVSLISDAPIEVLGVRAGVCEQAVPQASYPIWIG